jgi:dipeptidyl-peptidase-3
MIRAQLSLIVLATTACATVRPPTNPIVEQIGDTGFYAVEAPSFEKLDARQKMLAYWLGQAAIALDPIIYDQLSAYGLREKKLIGALVEDPARLPPESREAIVKYAKLFLGNRGNHNNTTNRKFLPELSFDQFKAAAHAALHAGARLGDDASLDALLDELKRPLFDDNFEPSPTNKNPPPGEDIITASSNTFYPGLTLADVKDFHDTHPLNSRVVKQDGKLVEQVYRNDDSKGASLYATQLRQASAALAQAEKYADDEREKAAIAALRTYFASGSAEDWHSFNVAWVQDDAAVDFVNGFIETYRDARAAKGAAEALVCVRDATLNPLMQNIAANALYFEKQAPWLDIYRKLDVKPPIGKAVEVVLETADFPISIIGDNLPNEEDIHQTYGTKNFLMTNASNAFIQTRGLRSVQEFMPDDVPNYKANGAVASHLITAMHEIIGHGSGKPRTDKPPRETLREYYSTLEEARADLVAYWNAPDPKLAALGVKDQRRVAEEMYANLARSIFGVLNHYPKGDTIEEDHDRDRMMIWNWVQERGGIGLVEKNGKHYAAVLDSDKTHKAVGELLAELMRIKGEGDYEAIKQLVTRYGLHFDTSLRDEEITRYKALGLPRFSVGIYGDLTLAPNGDVSISYSRDFLRQQISFARQNGTLGF